MKRVGHLGAQEGAVAPHMDTTDPSHNPIDSKRSWESYPSMKSRSLLRRLAGPLRSRAGLAGEESSAGIIATGRDFAAQAAPQDDLVTVTVDGKQVQVPKGASVLQACDAAGVDIPRRVYRISTRRIYSRALCPPAE